MTVVEQKDGRFVTTIEFTDYHLNAAGSVHGGMILCALDVAIAGGGAAGVNNGKDVYGITLTINCNFVAAAPPGLARCEAEIVGGGKSTKFVDARMLSPDGEIYATASGTVRVIPLKAGDEKA